MEEAINFAVMVIIAAAIVAIGGLYVFYFQDAAKVAQWADAYAYPLAKPYNSTAFWLGVQAAFADVKIDAVVVNNTVYLLDVYAPAGKQVWLNYSGNPILVGCNTTVRIDVVSGSASKTLSFKTVCLKPPLQLRYGLSSVHSYLELDITYYMGYPYGCRNNVHVAWGSTTANFCSSSNPGYATLWIDLTTGQWTTQKPSTITTCSPITPTNVQEYSTITNSWWGYLSYLNVWTSGNEVSFRGDGFNAQYGFTATAQGLQVTVYVGDAWIADWNQGADVYFYLCK